MRKDNFESKQHRKISGQSLLLIANAVVAAGHHHLRLIVIFYQFSSYTVAPRSLHCTAVLTPPPLVDCYFSFFSPVGCLRGVAPPLTAMLVLMLLPPPTHHLRLIVIFFIFL